MKLVNIADEGAKYKWQLYDLYDKAFPEQEKKPLQVMENLVADGKMEMLAMVDEDEFVGLAINLTTNITALVVFLINGKVLLPLGIAAGVCNMAGNYLGSHSFTSNGHKIVKPVMIVVIVIFFIKVLTELI